MNIKLPSGEWQLAARPKAGWAVAADDMWPRRFAFFVIGLLILAPTVAAGRLSDTRRTAIETLKRREAELERLSLVAKHASDSIILSAPSGEIQWVNDGFTRITGYSFDDAIGQNVGELLNSDNTNPETIEEMLIQRKQPTSNEVT